MNKGIDVIALLEHGFKLVYNYGCVELGTETLLCKTRWFGM